MNKSMRKIVALLMASMISVPYMYADATVYTCNTYSANGIIMSSCNAEAGTSTTYDALGRASVQSSIENGVPTTTTISYLATGETGSETTVNALGTTVTTFSNHGADSTTSLNGALQSTSHTNPDGITTQYTMGPDGTTVSKITTFDAHGEETSETDLPSTAQVAASEATAQTATSRDPIVSGTVTGLSTVNGTEYATVDASTVNLLDGKGAQSADGETVMVAVDPATAASLSSQLASANGQAVGITVAGNVSANVNGTMSMTEDQGGAVSAVGQTGAQTSATWTAANQNYISNAEASMTSTWAAANVSGADSTWQTGWNFIVGLASKL
ncbi:MAG: hypothetical protein ABSH12_01035 [Endomicrobiales bacterium]|jgi:hypothetical protein